MTLKCLSENDFKMPFALDSVFCNDLIEYVCVAFGRNYVKVKKDRRRLWSTKM